MSVKPKCPYCNSTEQPKSVTQDHHVTTVLLLYCAACGSILAAADFHPHYEVGGQRIEHEERSN
jgi:phage FluMu protein Com